MTKRKRILLLSSVLLIIFVLFSYYYRREIKYIALEFISENINNGIIPYSSLKWCTFPNPTHSELGGVPDGIMDITHPSIVYIDKGWNGYHYWAAASPYPQSLSETGEFYENSCIFKANETDNIIPTNFEGIKNNPIIQKNINSFNSDPDIFYNTKNNAMYCITRQCNDSIKIVIQKSTDGQEWSDPKLVISGLRGDGYLSPCLFWKDSVYYILMFMKSKGDRSKVEEVEIWSSKNIDSINFSFLKRAKVNGDVNIWHGDIFEHNGTLYAITCGQNNNFKYKLICKKDVSKYLFLGKLDNEMNIFMSSIPLIKANGVYRSSAFVDNNKLSAYVSFHYRYLKDKKAYPRGHRIACFSYDFEKLKSKTGV